MGVVVGIRLCSCNALSSESPARRDQPLYDLQWFALARLDCKPTAGHCGRATILCAAGDIHGALDRLFEDVFAFDV
jgi:hypothetical protein